ncbi:uncharacterized protein DDB_G0283697-like [Mytilus californianus]|uniref:uncharacterized protein DDB_G0283697-like n=1 Tax=Mytilus californianus TaxID=6549 RepID=UPI002245C39A|nr:uncharacterized protein DDB_G0283697-like [Mytilus californianus]XP_052060861.1 uncharacterized protein DDB_G0283697-like [Mytilus californianus]
MGVNNVLLLLDMLNSLPPTSVYNETAFNQMKLLKTDRRHRLGGSRLDDCMMTKLEAPSVQEFDPSDAIDKWMSCGQGSRRTQYQRKLKSAVKENANNNLIAVDSDNESIQDDNENIAFNENDNVENVDMDQELADKEPEPENENQVQDELNEDVTVDQETLLLEPVTNENIITVQTTTDEKDDSDDDDEMETEDNFEFEQSEDQNWSFIVKFSCEE